MLFRDDVNGGEVLGETESHSLVGFLNFTIMMGAKETTTYFVAVCDWIIGTNIIGGDVVVGSLGSLSNVGRVSDVDKDLATSFGEFD